MRPDARCASLGARLLEKLLDGAGRGERARFASTIPERLQPAADWLRLGGRPRLEGRLNRLSIY